MRVATVLSWTILWKYPGNFTICYDYLLCKLVFILFTLTVRYTKTLISCTMSNWGKIISGYNFPLMRWSSILTLRAIDWWSYLVMQYINNFLTPNNVHELPLEKTKNGNSFHLYRITKMLSVHGINKNCHGIFNISSVKPHFKRLHRSFLLVY